MEKPGSPTIRKVTSRRYIETAAGQVHVTQTRGLPLKSVPLICLHATAYSGQTFLPLMADYAQIRRVIAPDMLGYGGSDRPEGPVDIAYYANALAMALDADGLGPVHLLGYHTGAFVACELAIQRPDLVSGLVLIGVPFYLGEARSERRATLAKPHYLHEDLTQFSERWSYFIELRAWGQTLDRGFENFVDELRAYPNGWWAHEAAFTYPAEDRLPQVRQRALILNPENALSAPSRLGAKYLPNATLIEMPHLSHAIFDLASAEIRDAIEAFLDPFDAGMNKPSFADNSA